jgi:urease subunit beta
MVTSPGPNDLPGQIYFAEGDIEINAGRRTLTLTVRNTGDRAAQIGSHFHFFEVNRALDFDRPQAMGMRLNIAAGTSVRFEPGQERQVELVEIAGTKRAVGFNSLTMGSTSAKWNVKAALDRMNALGFNSTPEATMEAGAQQAAADYAKESQAAADARAADAKAMNEPTKEGN